MSEANEVLISSHIQSMSRLDDIQTVLKPLQISKKLKCIFMIILGLTESFTMMNRPNPTVTLFDGLFLGKYKR